MQLRVSQLSLTFMIRVFLLTLSLLGYIQSSACYIIVLSDGNQILVGNHEDWYAKDAGIKIMPPTAIRYGSIIFTFMSEGWAQGGMNEHGLFFDAARTPFSEIQFDAEAREFHGYIWQTILDKCKTVDEALAFIRKYKLPELSDINIVLADATGNAVIVGVNNGGVSVQKIDGNYLCQTNFNLWHPELSEEPTCRRFEKTKVEMNNRPEVSLERLKQLMELTHQDSLTVYTNLYDLKGRKTYTYNKRDFSLAIVTELPDIFQYGECLYSLDSLARNQTWEDCIPTQSYIVKGKVIDQATREPIPYVNIGLPGQNIGTLADPDGSFDLSLPESLKDSSIFFSSIGYDRYTGTRSKLSGRSNGYIIEMKPNATLLKEVVVHDNQRTKIERLGWMGGKDGVLPMDTVQGGGAVALLLQAPSVNAIVNKLQVRLMYNSKDTLTLRLHFYEYDSINQIPGKEILRKEILLRERKRFGWLRFDLRKHDIVINSQKFFVAFEWIENRDVRSKMLAGLRQWEMWKKTEYERGNAKVERIELPSGFQHKYRGDMMDWPGFKSLPPFTGLMVETGKHAKTQGLRTFERKTSFGDWTELSSTLNAVVTIAY